MTKLFDSVEGAWEAVRQGFVDAIDLAARDEWAEIGKIEALASGPALVNKTLSIYYPDEMLPINSQTHLRHFLLELEEPRAEDPALSTQTHYIYNLNENLIVYSSLGSVPDIVAPDSICYYSESTGLGFSNASDDLAVYFDAKTGRSTGRAVSIIKVDALPQLYLAAGAVASFAGLLRNIGYAGALPYPA